MAPSRRAAAASNAATRVKKLASSSKPSTKAKVKASNKRTRNRKDQSKPNARPQSVKQAAPSASLAGRSSNASGHSNGRKSNSQRATGVAVKSAPRKTTAAKSGSQAQQRNSGRKPKTQRLMGVSAKSAPLKPTRRFNAEAAGNRKQTQNSKKTKSSIKAGRQAGAAKQRSSRRVGVQSKENGHVKASPEGKTKKAVVSPSKSAGKATTPRTGRKRKAPEEDPAIMGDENVEMLATDTRVEPVRLPLELSKKNVEQSGSGSKLWFLQKFLATLPARDARVVEEAVRSQEATAGELIPNTVHGRVEDLEDDSESSSELSSSLSSSSGSLSQTGAVLAQLLMEQQKRRKAFEELQEKECRIKEQQIKLLEESAKREMRLIALLDELCKK